ncbi:MAG: hypothetical protein AAFN10_20730 [Bacteroidota bacterium]
MDQLIPIQDLCHQISKGKYETLQTIVSETYVNNLKKKHYCLELIWDQEVNVINAFPKLIKAKKVLIPLYEWNHSVKVPQPDIVFYVGTEKYSTPAYGIKCSPALRDSLYRAIQAAIK